MGRLSGRVRGCLGGGGEGSRHVLGRDGDLGIEPIPPMCHCFLLLRHGCPCRRRGEERIRGQGWQEAVRSQKMWMFESACVYATMAPHDPVGNEPIFGD